MSARKNHFYILLAAVLLAAITPQLSAETAQKDFVTIHKEISPDIQRLVIPLKYSSSRSSFYSYSQNSKTSIPINPKKNKGYSHIINF